MLECIIKWLSFSCMNDHVLLVDRHLSCFNFLWAYIFSPCRHIPSSGTGLCSMSRVTRSSKYVRMRIREWLRRNEKCISNPYHIYNKHSRRMLVTATFITMILHEENWNMINELTSKGGGEADSADVRAHLPITCSGQTAVLSIWISKLPKKALELSGAGNRSWPCRYSGVTGQNKFTGTRRWTSWRWDLNSLATRS